MTIVTLQHNVLQLLYNLENIMSSTISLRLPDQLANELNDIARETERSKSFHIQKALELYLQEQADLQIARDRQNDVTDHAVDIQELRKQFDL
jgi:RHH-type transcriptional regulator, rel operon repressor / antitoxin RelB